MSDNFFDKMTKEIKTIAQYKQFAQAQHETIVELGSKVADLEKKLQTVPTQTEAKQVIIHLDTNLCEEEIICLTQLALLKRTSEDRELTLEEAKKVDIYSKILNQLKNNQKKIVEPPTNLTDEELLKLVENNG